MLSGKDLGQSPQPIPVLAHRRMKTTQTTARTTLWCAGSLARVRFPLVTCTGEWACATPASGRAAMPPHQVGIKSMSKALLDKVFPGLGKVAGEAARAAFSAAGKAPRTRIRCTRKRMCELPSDAHARFNRLRFRASIGCACGADSRGGIASMRRRRPGGTVSRSDTDLNLDSSVANLVFQHSSTEKNRNVLWFCVFESKRGVQVEQLAAT